MNPLFSIVALIVMVVTLAFGDSIIISGPTQISGSVSLSVTPGVVSYFYGLTSAGGIVNGSVPNGNGVAYKVRGDGSFVSLYQFPFVVNQEVPVGGFIQATNGYLYGITQDGGANSKGTVFRMTTNGSYVLIHSFLNATDGGFPNPTLLQANDGFLYGMCSQGGSAEGTLFKCSLTGTFSTLHDFSGGSEGGQPYGTVIQTTDGSLYGTCSAGGANDTGSIFKCTLAGTCTAIYSFSASGATDGSEPRGDLLQLSNGEMYGITVNGGTSSQGVIFKVTTNGSYTALHMLTSAEGGHPTGSLILANDGNLWGMAPSGGANGAGSIFKMATDGTFTRMHSMVSATEGSSPQGPLVLGLDGWMYGTAQFGGASGKGTVFRISTSGTFQVIYSFSGSDGAFPSAGRLLEVQGSDSVVVNTNFPGSLQLLRTGVSDAGGGAWPFVSTDSSGNIVDGGYFYGSLNFGNGAMVSPGGQDAFIAKYDYIGNVLWTKQFGSTNDDGVRSITTDSSGNVIVTGFFGGTVNFGGSNLTSVPNPVFGYTVPDAFIAKYSSAGNLSWVSKLGGVATESGYGVATDSSGNIFIATTLESSNVVFGAFTLSSAGGDDVLLAKISPTGTVIWAERWGGANNDQPHAVAVDQSGNLLVCGSWGGGDIGGGSNVSSGVFVAKYSGASGAYQWAKITGSGSANSVAIDLSTNVVITGILTSSADFGTGPTPSGGIFLASYSQSGVNLWAKTFNNASFPPNANDVANGIGIDSTGNISIVGQASSVINFGGGGFRANSSGFVANFNSSGVYKWSRFQNASTTGYGVIYDIFGRVVTVGHFRGTVDFGGSSASSISVYGAPFTAIYTP